MDLTFQISIFLSGSFVGLIIKEVSLHISKRNEHKREVDKMLLERKLEAAEKAMAYYSSYIQRTLHAKNGFQSILNSVRAGKSHFPTVIETMETLAKQILELEEIKFDSDKQTVNLYFDFTKTQSMWTESDTVGMIDLMADLTPETSASIEGAVQKIEGIITYLQKTVSINNEILKTIKEQVKK